MSIYPEGVNPKDLLYTWEIAALDVPVPSDLTRREDASEWRNYLDCLKPSQQLRKFGQALDQFHASFDKSQDPLSLPEEKQVEIYSKWHAAAIANAALSKSFQFMTEEMFSGRTFRSDIGKGIYCITDFLSSVNSPETGTWEERLERHQNLDRKILLPFLNKFSTFSGRNTGPSAPPSGP